MILVRIPFQSFITSSLAASTVHNIKFSFSHLPSPPHQPIMLAVAPEPLSLPPHQPTSVAAPGPTSPRSSLSASTVASYCIITELLSLLLQQILLLSRTSRCINTDSLPMLVPQAHSPSRTSYSTYTELLSLLVRQMLALPAPAHHATDMLSQQLAVSADVLFQQSALATNVLSQQLALSVERSALALNMLSLLALLADMFTEQSALAADMLSQSLFYGLAAHLPTQLFYGLVARSTIGYAHADFGHAHAGAITPSRPARAHALPGNVRSASSTDILPQSALQTITLLSLF
ncbi:hypothetical protein T492DRAFT_1121299 [Pavlovales sp. CCMP2436]|nr:hypothetical protein T492DRAFT_1121299 [Pavlovales sp. CCMP2436]